MKWPYHTSEEREKVLKILSSGKTNYWSGNECILFEREFAKKFKLGYCCAISNASVGLEIALKALNIKPGDVVLIPSKSYFSTAGAVVNVGAVPKFLDVNINTQGLEIKSLEQESLDNVKAIICVHLGGVPCDIANIKKFARKNNLKLIEDCSQAHGAKVNNKYVGSFGDISVWSFCYDKIISTGGEGGMISTKNRNIWKKIWSLKEIGKNYDSIFSKKHKFGFKWVHDSFGSNYRMTEIQAGIGRIQLKKLFFYLKRRRENYLIYSDELKKFNLIYLPVLPKNNLNAPYRFYMYLNHKYIKKNIRIHRILKEINRKGVDCGSGSCSEIYLENSFKKLFAKKKENLQKKKIASYLTRNAMAFKLDPTYTKKKIRDDIKIIKTVISKYKI
jgi:dTDP-4-amino-4,6-dideoxygalactose transaminase